MMLCDPKNDAFGGDSRRGTGIDGDDPADGVNHGGPDKAVWSRLIFVNPASPPRTPLATDRVLSLSNAARTGPHCLQCLTTVTRATVINTFFNNENPH